MSAWLRTGLGADQQIPRSHLVATCDRVLRVRPEVRDAVTRVLQQVTPEKLEQYEALLLDHRSVRRLADETLNNETVVTPTSAPRLLEAMRQATAEQERERHSAEMAALQEKHGAERRQQKADSRAAAEQVEALTSALEREDIRKEDLLLGAIASTNRSILAIELLIYAAIVILCAGAVLDYFTGWLSLQPAWGWATAGAFVVSTYYLITDILQHSDKFGMKKITNYVARRLIERKIASLHLGPGRSIDDVAVAKGRVTRLSRTSVPQRLV